MAFLLWLPIVVLLQTPLAPPVPPTVTVPPSLLFAPTLSPIPPTAPQPFIIYVTSRDTSGPYGNGTPTQNPTAGMDGERAITEGILVALITASASIIGTVYVTRMTRRTATEREHGEMRLAESKFQLERVAFLERENLAQLAEIEAMHGVNDDLLRQVARLEAMVRKAGDIEGPDD